MKKTLLLLTLSTLLGLGCKKNESDNSQSITQKTDVSNLVETPDSLIDLNNSIAFLGANNLADNSSSGIYSLLSNNEIKNLNIKGNFKNIYSNTSGAVFVDSDGYKIVSINKQGNVHTISQGIFVNFLFNGNLIYQKIKYNPETQHISYRSFEYNIVNGQNRELDIPSDVSLSYAYKNFIYGTSFGPDKYSFIIDTDTNKRINLNGAYPTYIDKNKILFCAQKQILNFDDFTYEKIDSKLESICNNALTGERVFANNTTYLIQFDEILKMNSMTDFETIYHVDYKYFSGCSYAQDYSSCYTITDKYLLSGYGSRLTITNLETKTSEDILGNHLIYSLDSFNKQAIATDYNSIIRINIETKEIKEIPVPNLFVSKVAFIK